MAEGLSYVFIATSFDRAGRAHARRVADFLTCFGVRCVYGEVFGGGRICEGVRAKIDGASFVVAIVSRGGRPGRRVKSHALWVAQEIAWADGRSKPCLLLVEKGLPFSGGLLGDVEVVRFSPSNFSDSLPDVLRQVQVILKRVGLTIGVREDDPVQFYVPRKRAEGKGSPAIDLHDRALMLLERGDYDRATELAVRLTTSNPNYWRGWLTLGALYVKQLDFIEGDEVFRRIVRDFAHSDEACGAAYHNRGWVVGLKSLPNPSTESLNKETRFYERALAKDSSRVYTRAALVCTYVLLGRVERAHALLEESAMYGEDFMDALRHELKSRGALRIKILPALPALAQNLLYPLGGSQQAHARQHEASKRDYQHKGEQHEQAYVSEDEEGDSFHSIGGAPVVRGTRRGKGSARVRRVAGLRGAKVNRGCKRSRV